MTDTQNVTNALYRPFRQLSEALADRIVDASGVVLPDKGIWQQIKLIDYEIFNFFLAR